MRNKPTLQMLVQPLISHYYVKISKTTSVICGKRSWVNCKRVKCGPPLCFTISGVRYVIFPKVKAGGYNSTYMALRKTSLGLFPIPYEHQCELSVVLTIRLGGNRDSHRWAILFLILWHWTETNFSKNTFKTHFKKKIKLADNWKQRFSQGYHWLWTS